MPGADDATIPSVRIRWDSGTVPEWYDLLGQVPRSTLTQAFGYAAAMLTVERWRPRLGIIELAEKPIGLVVMMEKRAFGVVTVARLHRGPLIRPEAAKPAVYASVFKLLRAEYPRTLLRRPAIVPELPATEEMAALLRWAGWRHMPGPGYRTLWLDLAKTEAELRKGLAQKWRNALNQAERNGLTVKLDRSGELLPWLVEQYLTDRAAKEYRGPSVRLLTRLRTAMHKDGDVLILQARTADGTPVAGVLLLGHGKAATYQVGWTGEAGRRLRAHNLLLWRAVLELKGQGRRWLDLGGILPDRAPGVTAFKRGLGAEEVELVGAWH